MAPALLWLEPRAQLGCVELIEWINGIRHSAHLITPKNARLIANGLLKAADQAENDMPKL